MHNIVKSIASLVFVILVCGCSDGISVKTEKTDYQCENGSVYAEIPVINGLKDQEFQDGINERINKEIENERNIFLDEASEEGKEKIKESHLEIKSSAEYNKNGLLSLLLQSRKYTSGLDDVFSRYVINLDTNNEKEITLNDIFTDEEYIPMLNKKLEELSGEDIYSDIWETPVIGEKQNEMFYFSPEGLIIYYPPYELSYYSRGYVEFCVPYKELYGYLSPEYSDLIK